MICSDVIERNLNQCQSSLAGPTLLLEAANHEIRVYLNQYGEKKTNKTLYCSTGVGVVKLAGFVLINSGYFGCYLIFEYDLPSSTGGWAAGAFPLFLSLLYFLE